MQYQYDQLGRLLSAATQGAGGWGLAWNHDGFGNLTQQSVTKGSLTGFAHSVNGATNRINGQTYDANGNWGGSFGQSQSYDIENRIRTAAGPQFSETYLYSARNERMVSQRDQDRHRVHFYGADGLLLGIYTLEITNNNLSNTWPVRIAAQERIYFGGRLMQIGGEWVATDRLGSVVRKGTTNYKYAPYGQEIGGATANDTNKFATYTRDSVSGLDYALNRYYKPEWGRFTSPDPSDLNVRYGVPGSWNLYAYSDGDPINMYDPEGLGFWSAVGGFFKKIAGAVSDRTVSLFSSNGQDVAEPDEGVGDPAGGDSGGGGGGGGAQSVVTSTITYPPAFFTVTIPFGVPHAGIPVTVYGNRETGQICGAIGLEVSSSPVTLNAALGSLISQPDSTVTDGIMNGFGWSAGGALAPIGYQVFWAPGTGAVSGPMLSLNPARVINISYGVSGCRFP